MNTERQDRSCSRRRADLVRLACDRRAEPPADLRAHLSTCSECREKLEIERELATALREALRPEPLSRRFRQRINAELCSPRRSRVATLRWTVRLSLAAAAAAALALILRPLGEAPAGPAQTDPLVIAEARWRQRWNSPEDSVRYLERRMDNVAQSLERDPGGESCLPWGPEDDWDMPVGERVVDR